MAQRELHFIVEAKSIRPAAPAGIAVTEPLGDEIRRLILTHLDNIVALAADQPEGPDAAIHQIRKSSRRSRALLRLVRDEIGTSHYRAENAELRDAARQLSPARDALVRTHTLRALRERHGTVLTSDAFAFTAAQLERLCTEATGHFHTDPAALSKLLDPWLETWDRVAAWTNTDPISSDDFVAIAPGLHRVYRRGRRRMNRALASSAPADLHEWRKRVKDLRYQLEAIKPLWPSLVKAQAARLESLSETLGDERDLGLLVDLIATGDTLCPDPTERIALEALAHRDRLALRRKAERLGLSLYTETPNAFVDRFGAYWAAARG